MATEKTTKSTSEKTTKPKVKKARELYYFYSLGCAWCKKLEPMIDELNKEGYNIIKLDTGDKDNREAKKELTEKYDFKCGTPLLIDPENGNKICGYRDKTTVTKLAQGESIPEPPRPKSPPPRPPKMDEEKDITRWKKEYETWRADNTQVKNIPETEVMFSNLKKQFELAKQNKAGTSPENISVRLDKIEHNLKKLMAHLGLK
tara:strand:- start:120 stop:728 length:609 start_codon:yes stop_codon:yes gene_type:complete